MADQAQQLIPAAEFQALPLGYIVAEPLKAAIMAQAIAAKTTQDFINNLLTGDADGPKTPITVDFEAMQSVGTGDTTTIKKVSVSAPLLAMVPIPHLRIDSLTTHFKYEISSVAKSSEDTSKGVNMNVETGSALSLWAKGSITGSVSSKSSSESVMNRSGVLEITVNASEAPMPEGLAKILGILANSITVQESK
ncbi:MAG TPA: DUF2589 domain-containing protein [Tenuifilaceae bacterium]|nr:DUF2589 domain-containing protein [Tenuifilaceae bacterium]HQB77622.1 DUF2589 domain-containing protein [Tenuifilaceae bacterium]